jgi:AcrR family transcriptional regulator
MRGIAAAAGVDAALLHHYFGTKQQLFIAAMALPVDIAVVVPMLMAGPPDGVGERFIRFVLAQWEQPAVRPLFLGIVRSASTDPVAAAMLRATLAEGPLLAIARALGTPDAQLRATLAGSQFIGLIMARYVVGVEPLASVDAEVVARVVGPTIQRYLAGDL